MKSNTLLIKHFPGQLSKHDREEFLKACGATDVKILTSKVNKYNAAFARFPNEEMAEKVLRKLHQQEMMGSLLAVEFTRQKLKCHLKPSTLTNQQANADEDSSEILLKRFKDRLNSWIDDTNLRVPVPRHLRYFYPPPDASTLRNVARLLMNVPKLYTQVLHLINKMNLPCPIGEDLPGLGALPPKFYAPEVVPPLPTAPHHEPEPTISSESESEISSSDNDVSHKETIPIIKKVKKKTLKRPFLVKPPLPVPTKTKKMKFEAVFEKPTSKPEESTKQLKGQSTLKERPPLVKAKESEEKALEVEESAKGFGVMHPVNQPKEEEAAVKRDEREEERSNIPKVKAISAADLTANRISEKDRAVLPVFKNYAEGAPTCRLYVKNLAKQTTEEDLSFIYSRFRTQQFHADTPDMFDIKLMQQGRMKGQAFVTLESTDLAKQALAETNGYILHDKPMVVQFARSAVK